MSAWAEVVNHDGSDEWLELCSRALEEVQRETSRRNAAKIRTACYDAYDPGMPGVDQVAGMAAAGLIDPEPRCVGCGELRNNGKEHGHGAEFGGCV
ncbi:hypothetical protein [Streptomyces sp. NPDC004528]|uniref:hypothetical protein n=1 Tax=Streptomyces sp. NPDC004528 TaxID=3154550 RepID=UPI0033AF11A9